MQQPNEKVMFFGRNRVFYHGLIGRVDRQRLNGAFTIYAAQGSVLCFSVGSGSRRFAPIAAVPPHTPHMVRSTEDRVSVILIEPESVADAELDALRARIEDPERGTELWWRIGDALSALRAGDFPAGMAAEAFDRTVLGQALSPRDLDPRIGHALALFETSDLGDALTVDDIARAVRLSASRFLRLFKEQTGLRFRSYRMWRRARAFLPHAANAGNLAHLALELGYPDSTHFSHSIRRVYGLKPRSILEGSQRLQVIGQSKGATPSGDAALRPAGGDRRPLERLKAG